MWRIVLLLGFVMVLAGCPESKTPPPASSTAIAPASATETKTMPPAASTTAVKPGPELLTGAWTIWLRSDSPGINPDFFDTPEKKAKVLFDHEAKIDQGRIRLVQKTLQKDWLIKDEAVAQELDKLVTKTDWSAVQQRTKQEEPAEGGTEFKLTVTLADGSPLELTTNDIDQHPELQRLKEILKTVAGMPKR